MIHSCQFGSRRLVGPQTVHHWDGATTTTAFTGPADVTFYAVWASGPSDVWIAGDGAGNTSHLVHFDGHAWTEDHSELTLQPLHALWGARPKDVWALAGLPYHGSRIYHFDGASWTPTTYDTGGPYQISSTLRDIWGPAPRTCGRSATEAPFGIGREARPGSAYPSRRWKRRAIMSPWAVRAPPTFGPCT